MSETTVSKAAAFAAAHAARTALLFSPAAADVSAKALAFMTAGIERDLRGADTGRAFFLGDITTTLKYHVASAYAEFNMVGDLDDAARDRLRKAQLAVIGAVLTVLAA